MADIFGKMPHDYGHYNALVKRGGEDALKDYIERHAATREDPRKPHDFDVLNPASMGPQLHTHASDDVQVLGYATDNLEAMDAQVDRILYDDFRLNEWVPVKSDMAEGALSYTKRTFDHWGTGQFVDAHGGEIQTVGVQTRMESFTVAYAGIGAKWNLQEMRQNKYAGVPLDTEKIRAATIGAMTHMENVALKGDDDLKFKGVLNQDTSDNGSDATKVGRHPVSSTLGNSKAIKAQSADELDDFLNKIVDDMIIKTNGIMGRQIKGELCFFVPMEQYLYLSRKRVNPTNDANRSRWDMFAEASGWTRLAGSRPVLKPLIELNGAGKAGVDRMLVLLKTPFILEMPIPFMPRFLSPERHAHSIHYAMEYSMGGVNVYRPQGMIYVDGV